MNKHNRLLKARAEEIIDEAGWVTTNKATSRFGYKITVDQAYNTGLVRSITLDDSWFSGTRLTVTYNTNMVQTKPSVRTPVAVQF